MKENKFTCTINILSPVHIGSGVKLRQGFDFFNNQNSTYIVPQSALTDYLLEHPEDIVKFNDVRFLPLNLLKSIPKKNLHGYPVSCSTQDLHEFERNGFGYPYIPGSSIKGAIRTILLRTKMQKISMKNEFFEQIGWKKERADQPFITKAFVTPNTGKGKESNYNILRTLSVGDAHFTQKDMELAHIKILNLSNREGTNWSWKKTPNHRDMEVYAETLAMDAQSNLTLRIDDFFFLNQEAKRTFGFTPILQEKLFTEINEYSRHEIEKEILFFEQFSDGRLNDLLEDLFDIQESIPVKDSPNEKTSCVFRLGWGINWKSMTGNWMNDAEVTAMKSKFQLGKRDFPIFPKTRKIVIDGNPRTVTGWIRLSIQK